MGYINYFSGIVKVLETPIQHFLTEQITLTTVRVELPQPRNKHFITLHFWGNLARDLKIYYQPQDYILIEGYISVRSKKNINLTQITSKQSILTVLKVYPLNLTKMKNLSRV